MLRYSIHVSVILVPKCEWNVLHTLSIIVSTVYYHCIIPNCIDTTLIRVGHTFRHCSNHCESLAFLFQVVPSVELAIVHRILLCIDSFSIEFAESVFPQLKSHSTSVSMNDAVLRFHM